MADATANTEAANTDAVTADDAAAERLPRPVAFTDAEWQGIEAAAAAAGVEPLDFVRGAALTFAARPRTVVGLIERTWLNTYLLAMLRRDEMILEGRREEFDQAVQSARGTLAALQGGGRAPAEARAPTDGQQ